jgi:ribonuclease III
MDENTLNQAQELLGHTFSDLTTLETALIHASHANNRLDSNERLEFLGDAILALVICEELYKRFPDYLEGDLTKIKSMLVSRRTCAKIGKNIGLQNFLILGKGVMESSAVSGSIVAGALESVIAALYIDGGLETARNFILKAFSQLIEAADAQAHQENFKSVLQQHVQQQGNTVPVYELLDEKGPDHNKCFESAVVIGEKRFKSAWGTNKKEAEQMAAYNALLELKVIQPE